MVERAFSIREVLGSIPSISSFFVSPHPQCGIHVRVTFCARIKDCQLSFVEDAEKPGFAFIAFNCFLDRTNERTILLHSRVCFER